MQDRETRRRAAKRAAIALSVLLLILAAVYIIVQLYAILGRTYRTETAIAYTMEDTLALPGIAMFDSAGVPGSGNLGYLVEDGERVTEGTVLAEVYTDPAQGARREELDRLDRQIDLLTKSENSVGSDLTLLTTQTQNALYDLLDQLDTAAYTGMRDAIDEFLLAQNRLQVSTGQSGGFDATIAALQAERDAAAAALQGLAEITADRNGYFISTAAAQPLALSEEELKNDTPAALNARLQQPLETTGADWAGRIVTGFSWRFYGVCTLAQADRFDGVTRVQIRVPGKQDEALDATVVEVLPDEESGLAAGMQHDQRQCAALCAGGGRDRAGHLRGHPRQQGGAAHRRRRARRLCQVRQPAALPPHRDRVRGRKLPAAARRRRCRRSERGAPVRRDHSRRSQPAGRRAGLTAGACVRELLAFSY